MNPDLFDDFGSLHQAVGLRNRLAHGYDQEISDESIWSVVEHGIPQLLAEVEARL